MKPLWLRIILWCFSHISYRLAAERPDRLPDQGGALLVSNHQSFVDMLLILASTRRFVRFVLPEEICRRRWLAPWLRLLKAIPLPEENRPKEMAAALKVASDAIANGEVVGIFAEKSISRIGVLLPFHDELERIMKGSCAPIIPVCLDGVWGSIFSFHAGRFFWKIPRFLPFPVGVSFGEPLPATATASEVRSAIQELNSGIWRQRRRVFKTLGRGFIRCARVHPFRFAMGDAQNPAVSIGQCLTRSIFLARRLRPHWSGQRMVGILLPPSVAGALVNLAALVSGRVPVNLNYTLSSEVLASCASQCGLRSIVSSKLFLAKLKFSPPDNVLFLEDVAAKPRLGEKLLALVLRWLAPAGLIEKATGCERTPELDDLATVIFSSGSTGEPKGVMLSHYNLVSNVEQLGQTFDISARDRFLGILPFFHSFGFTATLVVPALQGVGVVYHPNPRDGKGIGELVRRHGITYLMATPTFLQGYLRTCEPADFGSLRFVMTAAEKLPEWLATAFHEKFGIRPVEGYGCTECSPVVSANTHEYRAAGMRQQGSRQGTIGYPLPGVSVRIVDPDTRAPVKNGESGLLFVRGPNVMQGYLGKAEKTAEVLKDGWYETGDIARLDEDGFLQITDRISRFSKIGGEMVPHVKVEERLQQLSGCSEIAFAVTGVPDDKKGERLVVLHKLDPATLEKVVKNLNQLDLPNLWIPKANQFFAVEELPYLATGKLDLRRIREQALRFSASAPKPAADSNEG